jgi:protein-S-isoprenylcysteine O-methyltransferase Ste14
VSPFLLIVLGWALLAGIAYLRLRRTAAPYGRHGEPGGGVASRWAWMMMELPSAISFAAIAVPHLGRDKLCAGALFVVWELHYLNRGLVYPLRLRTQRRVPWSIVLAACGFTTVNGLLCAWSLFVSGPELAPSSLRFLFGMVLFVLGAYANIDSDRRLMQTPRGSNGSYSIPVGGLYTWVSSPNYLGEMIEWSGWALASGTSAGLVFLLWTIANLLPRARANHAWYRARFAGYPATRAALVPRFWRRAPWLLLLAASGCVSQAVVRAEVHIAAPPAVVWQVLTDTAHYDEWNAFTPRVEGALAVGNQIRLHVRLVPGRRLRTQAQRVTELASPRKVRWETKVLSQRTLRAERTQTLTAEEGGTYYVTEDHFSGTLVPLVMRMYKKDLERGFADMVAGLKARAEAISRAASAGTPFAGRDAGGFAELSGEVLRRGETQIERNGGDRRVRLGEASFGLLDATPRQLGLQ